jgi:hypothetical protein
VIQSNTKGQNWSITSADALERLKVRLSSLWRGYHDSWKVRSVDDSNVMGKKGDNDRTHRRNHGLSRRKISVELGSFDGPPETPRWTVCRR